MDAAETQLVNQSLASARLHSLVLLLLAGLAVLLAAVGLFALVSVTVNERKREIGVRMALGARRGFVTLWVLSWSARLAVLAVAGGTALAISGGRTFRALLGGTASTDAVGLATAATVFFFLAIVATLLPAWRATRVDPAKVLGGD